MLQKWELEQEKFLHIHSELPVLKLLTKRIQICQGAFYYKTREVYEVGWQRFHRVHRYFLFITVVQVKHLIHFLLVINGKYFTAIPPKGGKSSFSTKMICEVSMALQQSTRSKQFVISI